MSLIIGRKPKTRIRRGIGGLGDSFTANCHTIAATAYATEIYGYLGQIASKTGLFASYLDNQGKIGDHTGQFMARLAAALASTTADLWLLPSTTNDRTTTGMTLADTKANVMRFIRAFANTPGKYLVVGTGTPRFGDKALTDAQAADALAYRDWVLNYVSRFVPVVNTWDGFTADMTVEGLHPNPLGAAFFMSRYTPVIVANFEWPGMALPIDATDLYSAIRPMGCLTPNPLLGGTTGTIPASVNPVAGSVLADSFKCSGSGLTGVTTRWYKETADIGEWQGIELGGNMTAAGGYAYVQPTANVTLSNLVAGDKITGHAAFDIQGSTRGILGWEVELIVVKPVSGTSTTIYYRGLDKYQEPFTLPANFNGALESQTYTFDGTETSISCRMGLYLATGIALDAKVKVKQFGLRKV